MLFLFIPATLKTIIEKVKTDSHIEFESWPTDATVPVWIKFKNQAALGALHSWLQNKSHQKVSFVDAQTDIARKRLGLAVAQDFVDYDKVFKLIAPYLTGKPVHPYPKFSRSIANEGLAGFTNTDPSQQPVHFEITEGDMTFFGLLTHEHLINIHLILNENGNTYEREYQFSVPKETPAPVFKPFLLKFLTDPAYTFSEGKRCFDDFVAERKKRAEEADEE